MAVELDGAVETIELFDKPDTLRRLWPRLIRSYAIGALANPATAKSLSETDIASFLSRSVQAEVVHCTSLGAGTWIRLSSDDSVGAAVVCDDQLVHLALFASRNHPRPTRPNETRSQGATAPDQQAEDPQYRPWWRFWM